MFERFTDRARRVVVLAQEEARALKHDYIDPEHVLLGLIHEGEGVAAKALERRGISLQRVRQQVEQIIGQGQQAPSGHIPFTSRAKKVLELSLREALHLGHNYIGTEHILLGLIHESEGVAAQVLVKLGTDLNSARQDVIKLLSGYERRENALIQPVAKITSEKSANGTADKQAAARTDERPTVPSQEQQSSSTSPGEPIVVAAISFPYEDGSIEQVIYQIMDGYFYLHVVTHGRPTFGAADVVLTVGDTLPERSSFQWPSSPPADSEAPEGTKLVVSFPCREGLIKGASYQLADGILHILLQGDEDPAFSQSDVAIEYVTLPGVLTSPEDSDAESRRQFERELDRPSRAMVRDISKLVVTTGSPRERALEILAGREEPTAEMISVVINALVTGALTKRGLINPSAMDALLEGIKAAHVLTRWAQKHPRVLNELLTHTDDRRFEVRAGVIRALSEITQPNPEVVTAIRSALSDDSGAVRRTAVLGWAKVGTPRHDVWRELLAAAADTEAEVRNSAFNAMGQLADPTTEAIALVRDRLTHGEVTERYAAQSAMGRWANSVPDLAASLFAMLKTGDSNAVEAVSHALWEFSAVPPESVNIVLDALVSHGQDRGIMVGLGMALGMWTVYSEEASSALLDLMHSPSPLGRECGLIGLDQKKRLTLQDIRAIIRTVGDPDTDVRRKAAETLGKVQDPSEEIWSVLVEALGDQWLGQAAWQLLSRWSITSSDIRDALLSVAESGPTGQRAAALQALQKCGGVDERVAPAVLRAMSDDDSSVRQAAVWSLTDLDERTGEYTDAFLTAARDPDGRVRAAAVKALGGLEEPPPEVVDALRGAAARDPDLEVRREALFGLRSQSFHGLTDPTLGLFLEALRHESWRVRQPAVMGLSDTATPSIAVTSALLGALATANEFEEWQIIEALGNVGMLSDRLVLGILSAKQYAEDRFHVVRALRQIDERCGDVIESLRRARSSSNEIVRERADAMIRTLSATEEE